MPNVTSPSMLNHVVVARPSWWKTDRVMPRSMKYASRLTVPERTISVPCGTSTRRIEAVSAASVSSPTGHAARTARTMLGMSVMSAAISLSPFSLSYAAKLRQIRRHAKHTCAVALGQGLADGGLWPWRCCRVLGA